MKFIRVPAGEFVMGSDEPAETLSKTYPRYAPQDLQALGDEAPRHRVRITRAFYFGQHEVTVDQFRHFIEASGYTPESIADGSGGYGYNPAHGPTLRQASASRVARSAIPGATPAFPKPATTRWSM